MVIMISLLILLSFPLLICAKTKVFVVLHSHNDAGWLETADYYYENQSQYILETMLDLLQENTSLKFSWAEVYFLSRYLQDHPSKKPIVLKLLQEKRLEIVGGGWVQNDEALPDYELVLRQMETGFEYLRTELNVTQIKTGWQLDPFGHSSLTAALWEKMGFESLVISRVELNHRSYLELTGNCEFIWKGEGFGSKNGVLAHLLNDHYYPPLFLDRQPWNDECCFKSLPADDEDIADCVSKFEFYVNSTQYKYRTDNQLMLMGGDFFFSNYTYSKLFFDMLTKIIERSPNLDIRFATPAEYFQAVYDSKLEFEVFQGDLFPLISSGNPYNKAWTGFFSTKPTLKKEINDVQTLARASEILQSVVMNRPFIAYNLALSTHHDAITGTCKPWVFTDYLEMLDEDRQLCYGALSQVYNRALPNDNSNTQIALPYKVLYLFNPLDWQVTKTITFDSQYMYAKVFDSSGNLLIVQSVPWSAGFRFYFQYTLDAYTLAIVFVSELNNKCQGCSVLSKVGIEPYINNGLLELTFKNGLLDLVSNTDAEYKFDTKLMNYTTRQSGAYTFCPYKAADPTGILQSFLVYTGPIVQVAVSEFLSVNETFTQRLILEAGSKEFKINFALRPPPNSDIYLRFNKKYSNRAWFYTFNTANIMRKYFKYDSLSRKGNNYYPINGAIFVDLITDYMYLIPSFPISGGMVTEKSFEVNLHRFTLWDDGLGLGNVTEQSYTVEHDWLVGFNAPEYSFIWKKFLEHKNQPVALFSSNNKNSVTPSIESADLFTSSWKTKTKIQFIQENSCSHIASLAQRDKNYLATVLNICGKPSNYPFQPDQSVNLGGLDVDKQMKVWKAGNNFGFWVYNNTGDNVIKYNVVGAEGKVAAFDLVAFRTGLEPVSGDGYAMSSSMIGSTLSYAGVAIVLVLVGNLGLNAIRGDKHPAYKL